MKHPTNGDQCEVTDAVISTDFFGQELCVCVCVCVPTVVANVNAFYPRCASQVIIFFKKWTVLASQNGLCIIVLCLSSAIG